VGDRRVSEVEQQKAAMLAAGLLPAVAAAVVFPFDRVLAGLAAAGHGLQAICLYLGLTPTVLLEHVVRLGLATPHDRPLRKSGARGWSVLDTMRLIAWRVAGVHPDTIGARLGRSASAVRAKARRMGLPVPDRKTLRKLDPGTLEDPVPGFGFGDLPQTTQTGAAAATPATLCGHAAGKATIDASLRGTEIILPHAAEPRAEPAKRPQAHARRANPAEGQRELQLFRIIRNPEPGPAPAADQQPARISRPSAPVVRRVSPVPQCERDVDFDDLTWLAHLKNPVKNGIAVWTLGLLRFGGLHWKSIAERIGRTPRATSSLLHRCDVPHDSDRSKFGSAFDREVALANLKEFGFEVRLDEPRRQYFWRCRGDRAKATRNRKSRLEMGVEEPYRTRTYGFVTRRDLDARPGRDAPFAGRPAMMRAW
jgi:hypothetical protein